MKSYTCIVAFVSSAAFAAPQVPDPTKVSNITEAAKLCELSEAGIEWKETSSTTIGVWVTQSDLTGPSPKMELLKTCLFAWAYDRNVTVEFNMKQP